MNFVVRVGLLLIIFLIPLITINKYFGYEQTKVLFLLGSVSLLVPFWWLTKPIIKWTVVTKAGGLFIIILFITALLGRDLKVSFLGSDPYFQGVILYAYLYLLYLMISQVKIKLSHWVLVLTLSSVFVSLLSIKDWILINQFDATIPTYAGRVVSTFGSPNLYSGFILLTLPLLSTKVFGRYWKMNFLFIFGQILQFKLALINSVFIVLNNNILIYLRSLVFSLILF